MKFGHMPLAQAEGAILAHRVADIPKGTRLTAANLAHFADVGLDEIPVAKLESGDVAEDDAATRLAQALTNSAKGVRLTKASTGRVNVVSEGPGLAAINSDVINAVNGVDPMITVATVPPLHRLEGGQLIATIKIISYAVDGKALAGAEKAAMGGLGLHAPRRLTVSLIETLHPSSSPSEKGAQSLRGRLSALGLSLSSVSSTDHTVDALSSKISDQDADIICLLTASATSDVRDVGPEALRQIGGTLVHFGMPVDPGNLLFIGRIEDRFVIGLPGCAKSPALNGADWVLERLICGVPVTSADITAMGVGGLLKEIPSRPRPRRAADEF